MGGRGRRRWGSAGGAWSVAADEDLLVLEVAARASVRRVGVGRLEAVDPVPPDPSLVLEKNVASALVDENVGEAERDPAGVGAVKEGKEAPLVDLAPGTALVVDSEAEEVGGIGTEAVVLPDAAEAEGLVGTENEADRADLEGLAKGGEVGADPGVEIALADGDVPVPLGVEPDLMVEAVDHECEEARRPPVGILVGAGAAVGSDETGVSGAVDVGETRPAIRAIVGVAVGAAVGESVVGDEDIDGGLDPRGQKYERASRGGRRGRG